ncbi:MAG: MoaD/ThiS family protein [Thermacetogeniaceae bacterium]
MRITVRYYGFVSSLTKKLLEELDVPENITIKELIEILTKRYGYKFEQICFIRPLYSERDYFNIYLNTKDLNDEKLFPDGLATKLSEGDIISFGPISGAA